MSYRNTPKCLLDVELNDQQYEAITSFKGVVVVCAGAGSGKTRVIAYRTLHLIKECNVNPLHITCVTFTNKASKEMKSRISLLLENESEFLPNITTFHGYGIKIIRKYGHFLGLEDLVIIDDDEQKNIITKLLENHINDKMYTSKKFFNYINAKNNNNLGEFEEYHIKQIYVYEEILQMYTDYKIKHRYMDFDDILFHTLSICKIDKVKSKIREDTKHFLVDEYQDTNIIQHEIVKEITQENNKLKIDSLVVVGDENQSIYSWRGANINNIINFKNDFDNTTCIPLYKNYRSIQPILNFANDIIEKNSNRSANYLLSDKQSAFGVIIFEYFNGYKESEATIRIIKLLKDENKIGSCAILYRSHYQSRAFEEELIKNNILYNIYGGINFYNRQEIKDVLSYLKLFINKYDLNSFIRSCNLPNRGFGEISLNKFLEFYNKLDKIPIIDSLEKYIDENNFPHKVKVALSNFIEIINSIEEFKDSPYKAISHIIKKIEYINYLEKIETDLSKCKERKENIGELIEAAKNFEQFYNSSIYDFIDHIFLMDEDKKEEKNVLNDESAIILMSIHAAKGLEFSTVFIVGLENGILPSQQSLLNGLNALEEERRLFYVAITRAKNRLFCSFVQQRNIWGYTRLQEKSNFIKNISKNAISINMINIPIYYVDKIVNKNSQDLMIEYNSFENNFQNHYSNPYSRLKN